MGTKWNDLGAWETLAKNAGFRVKRMAQLRRMSPRHLLRVFEKSFGLALRPWLISVKDSVAKHALAGGTRPNEVAHALGYKHPNHFSRAFRRVVGCSPTGFLHRATMSENGPV
ncbi:MAG: helix-turn-helix transcriptional regulator [Verrucomicrobia bacterium]|nr:helix-turn-helix transcriptional regulator [Verrucomicrobiota bacterium]